MKCTVIFSNANNKHIRKNKLLHSNPRENEDEDTSTTTCIGIHEIKNKQASSVLKRKKICGINFDGETINLTVKFSWEASGDGNKGQPVQ